MTAGVFLDMCSSKTQLNVGPWFKEFLLSFHYFFNYSVTFLLG